MNFFQKIIFIFLDLPFNLLRDLTIPACDLDCWNQNFFALMPLTSLVFIVLITSGIITLNIEWNVFLENEILLIITPIVVVLLMVIFKFTTYRNRLPGLFIVLLKYLNIAILSIRLCYGYFLDMAYF